MNFHFFCKFERIYLRIKHGQGEKEKKKRPKIKIQEVLLWWVSVAKIVWWDLGLQNANPIGTE